MKIKSFSERIILQGLKDSQGVFFQENSSGIHDLPPENKICLIESAFWGFVPSHWNSSVGFPSLLREESEATKTRMYRSIFRENDSSSTDL